MAHYTTIEDYYSDEEPSRSSSRRVSPQQQSPMFRKRHTRNYRPTRQQHMYKDESEDEEEISRAMYELGLDNRFGNVSRRSSYEYPPPSPGYYRPYMEEAPPPPPLPHYMVPPPHLPPPQWIPPYMMDEMSPRMAPMYRPYRSYNRRNPQDIYDQELDDQDDIYDDVNPEEYPRLSRSSSIASTGSRRIRRANSMSSMPPPQPYSPRRQSFYYPQQPPPPPPPPMMDPRFGPPPSMRRMVHSEPNTPPMHSESSSETDEEEIMYSPRRRSSINPRLGRSLSFSGGFPPQPPPNMHPQPPPPNMHPPGPPPIMMPPPMPHPMMDNGPPPPPSLQRANSLYSPNVQQQQQPPIVPPPTTEEAPAQAPPVQNPPSSGQLPPQQIPQQQIPGQQPMPQQVPGQLPQQMPGQLPQQMPGQMPGQMPPWGFPNTPGGMMQPLNPMFGMFNNPMMPQQPMLFMPDMWMNQQQQPPQPDVPLPFMNNDVPESPPKNEPPPPPHEDMHEPEMMMPPPPQPPMLKRGLSKLGGFFGGPMMDNFSTPLQGRSNKEHKLAKEYRKLGIFYCWRIAETQDNFESFSIPNQKIIKRKVDKGQLSRILLQKEKKLPGGIIIDLQTWRGCTMGMQNKQNVVLYLEIKQQDFNSMMGGEFVFNNGPNF